MPKYLQRQMNDAQILIHNTKKDYLIKWNVFKYFIRISHETHLRQFSCTDFEFY